MRTWKEFEERLLAENEELRVEVERLEPRYQLISDLIRLRIEKGLTQADVAARMGKQQPAIARFEAGNVQPSLTFLQELAEALDARLIVRIEPKETAQQAEHRAAS